MQFSIITITFNSEIYIKETLQSVANQNFTDYEHIIWDGGSTDRTLSIAQEFPHIIIKQGIDSGISDAMNKGASFAKGKYLLHLHSDDSLDHPDVLSHVHHFLLQHPHAEWVYGLSHNVNHLGKTLSQSNFIPFSAEKLRKYNIISHPSTFLKNSLFQAAGGFNTETKYCMDYELWLRLAEMTPAQAMPFVVSRFREHEGSLSTGNQVAVADEAYQVRNRFVKGLWERWRSYRTWKKRRAIAKAH
ncbi:PGL/p-HBAD biosynthesis glycosyltransferase Rv2957 [Chlamydiales bacterium SCGC AG-110-M15]|nr:PGL/p-HBAD biosynthesis glycosyltransferase Rv2957 [Chlamydiales bacterium SCGC AG-110-M15]